MPSSTMNLATRFQLFRKEGVALISAFSHAIKTTWAQQVLPKPSMANIEVLRAVLVSASEATTGQEESQFANILAQLNQFTSAGDTLSETAIEVLTGMVDSLPNMRRRATDGEPEQKALVLLADGYGELAHNLCVALAQMAVEIRVVRDIGDLNPDIDPDVMGASLVVVGSGVLDQPEALVAIAGFLDKIRTTAHAQPPVVLAADQTLSFEQRFKATRLGNVRIFRSDDDPRTIRDLLVSVSHDSRLAGSKVLLIEDSPTDAYRATSFMRAEGLLVEHVSDPSKALDAIRTFDPDLIVMDYHMPIANGDTMALLIRQDPEMTMPIIFLSSESDSEKQLLALSHGADGFVIKPLQQGAFIKAIKSMIMRSKAIDRRMRRDPLTNLLNHGQIIEAAKRLVGEGRGGCFAIIDIDHFKSVNDTYGHPVGDRVLIRMAEVLSAALRDYDSVGRMGGEEFAIVLPDTQADVAHMVIERIRKCFMSVQHEAEGMGSFACTFSGGIADLRSGVTAAIHEADEALYKAKHGGRNQIKISESIPAPAA